MTSFRVPKIHININEKHLKIKLTNNKINPYINKSLSKYLTRVKEKIEKYPNDWNYNKKYTNIYEFIHTSLGMNNNSISQLKPISRAFYKLIEIINTMNLLENYKYKNMKTFHIAEGPGGFIEAFSYLRNNKDDIYYGTTLIDETNNCIPSWKKSSIVSDNNIIIENGYDGTGNLYNKDNFLYFNDKYYDQFDFVTADGGIDFSEDFDKQEITAIKLIFCEIFYAMCILKKGGTFILKVFDIFHKSSIECVYLLSIMFKDVYIIKPKTSRTANSEKYIVCKHFDTTYRDGLIDKFYKILMVYNQIEKNIVLSEFLDIKMNHFFINKIQEFNSIIGNKQIKNILTTLKLIENNEKKNNKISSFKNENVQKCISWCIKNNIPYNKKFRPANIFLNRKI